MRVELLAPDAPPAQTARPRDGSGFGRAVDALGSALQTAERAEDAFAAGSGTLQNAVYERARADVALSVASAAAQRSVQALQSIFNMQV